MTNIKKDKRQMMAKEIALEVTTLIKPFFDSINHRLDGHDGYFTDITRQFVKIDKRFDGIDQRFDGVDKQFKAIDKCFIGMNQRFDRMDKRFDKIELRLDTHDRYFVGIAEQFNIIDRRFTRMETHFDKRFDTLEKADSASDARINRLEKEMGMVRTVLMVGNPKKD